MCMDYFNIIYKSALPRSSSLGRHLYDNSLKTQLLYLFYFSINVLFQKYKLLWVGHEQRSFWSGDSQTFLGKIGIKVQPIDQLCWIKFRVSEMNEGGSLQNFCFPSLCNRSNSIRHESSFEPNSKAREDPDFKKFQRFKSYNYIYKKKTVTVK